MKRHFLLLTSELSCCAPDPTSLRALQGVSPVFVDTGKPVSSCAPVSEPWAERPSRAVDTELRVQPRVTEGSSKAEHSMAVD